MPRRRMWIFYGLHLLGTLAAIALGVVLDLNDVVGVALVVAANVAAYLVARAVSD